MNIYVISQSDNNDYDTYDSAVVAAVSEDEARKINPCQYEKAGWWDVDQSSWTKKGLAGVKVELIGVAKEGTEPGVVLASFNAG
jgi:hypothetical protein